jgi:hypothetical protein
MLGFPNAYDISLVTATLAQALHCHTYRSYNQDVTILLSMWHMLTRLALPSAAASLSSGAADAGAMQDPTGPYDYCLPGDFPSPLTLHEVLALPPQAGRAAYYSTLSTFSAVLVVTPYTLKAHDVQGIRAALAQQKPVVLVRSRADETVCNIMRSHKGYNHATAAAHLHKKVQDNLVTEIGVAEAKQVLAFLVGELPGESFDPAASSINIAAGGASPGFSIRFDEAGLMRWIINTAAGGTGKPMSARQEQGADRNPVQEHQMQRNSAACQGGRPAPAGMGQLQPHPVPASAERSYPQATPVAAGSSGPTPDAGMGMHGLLQTKPEVAAKPGVVARPPAEAMVDACPAPYKQQQQQQQQAQRDSTACQGGRPALSGPQVHPLLGTDCAERSYPRASLAAAGSSGNAPAGGMAGHDLPETKLPAGSMPDAGATPYKPEQQQQRQQQQQQQLLLLQQNETQCADTAVQNGCPAIGAKQPRSVLAGVHKDNPHVLAPAAHSQQLAPPALKQAPQTDLIDLSD